MQKSTDFPYNLTKFIRYDFLRLKKRRRFPRFFGIMAGNFLTPTGIWKDFELKGEVTAKILKESSLRGTAYTHLRIDGRTTSDGAVGIYGVMVRKAQLNLAPAIVIVQDFKDGADTTLARYFAEKGFIALVIDLAGATEENKLRQSEVDTPYTIYPESLSYANYNKSEEEKTEVTDVRTTCWYEWGRVIRYAVEYIKAQPLVTKVGLFGVFNAATPIWQVISADCGISACAIIANAGWKGYKDLSKFGDIPEPQFGDDALKFLAGIEPQAYAVHVKCPLLMLSPTNSSEFNVDRTYDTISRINENIYHATDYSLGGREEINFSCFVNAEVFFTELLIKDTANLPKEVTVKGAIENGKLKISVTPDANGLKELFVYCAEEELNTAYRSWNKVTDIEEVKDGVYTFRYEPYANSGAVTFFARAGYENGMHVCSAVGCKKFTEKEAGAFYHGKVYYNSRVADADSEFYPAEENLSVPFGINLDKSDVIKTKNGPMDFAGLVCKQGVITFKPDVKKYKPEIGAIFMLDVFIKGEGFFTATLITDVSGVKTEYSAQEKIFGDFWQNVRFEGNSFKTAEGKTLKSFDGVIAVKFSADKDFIINNVLWV